MKKSLNSLLTGIVFVTLSAGTSTPALSQTNNRNLPIFTEESTRTQVVIPTITIPNNQRTIPVTIYVSDNQCQQLIPQQITVPSERTIDAALVKIFERQNTADFTVVGYRLSVNSATGVATVDMRLAPNSRRKFSSLSTCEQLVLFGSLRRTLTGNPAWKIRDVRFTNQGQEFYL